MDLAGATLEDRLSDAALRVRLATLDLRALDDGGVWVQRTYAARLAWLTGQAMLPDCATLYVSQVSQRLLDRVHALVVTADQATVQALLPCFKFLLRGRALDA